MQRNVQSWDFQCKECRTDCWCTAVSAEKSAKQARTYRVESPSSTVNHVVLLYHSYQLKMPLFEFCTQNNSILK